MKALGRGTGYKSRGAVCRCGTTVMVCEGRGGRGGSRPPAARGDMDPPTDGDIT